MLESPQLLRSQNFVPMFDAHEQHVNRSSSNIVRSARSNYSLVITVSSAFEDCTLKVAGEFPSTYFLTLRGVRAQ